MPPKAAGSDVADARATAERFLNAVKDGDEQACRAVLIAAPGETLNFQQMHESTKSYELGQPKPDGAGMLVGAKVYGADPAAPPMPLPVVLSKVGGAWKVDMGASIQKMMGGINLEELMTNMVKGLGEALGQGMQAVAGGLSEALSGSPAAPKKRKARPAAAKKKGSKPKGKKSGKKK